MAALICLTLFRSIDACRMIMNDAEQLFAIYQLNVSSVNFFWEKNKFVVKEKILLTR